MDFLKWYDWITPTDPYASFFFGTIFTILIAFIVWFETKKLKTLGIVFGTGLIITFVGVIFLESIGFYG